MTSPEIGVWQAVRGSRLDGLRFRRQHPIGPYILDFFCPARRLAVEIDGQGHGHPERMAHDARRDAWLERQGIRVLRLGAQDVLDDIEGAIIAIRASTRAREAEVPPVPAFHKPGRNPQIIR
jgi:very-short-patch-repair endonuclease